MLVLRRGVGVRGCVLGAALIACLAGPARASATVDLLAHQGLRFDGATDFAMAGGSVDSGDVNGDGRPDLIVAAPNDFSNGTGAGSVYVVFGPPPTAPLDLASLAKAGYRIDGGPSDQAGTSASSAGDVNGDGLDDVIVGVPGSNSGPTPHAVDSAYVVFGKKTTSRVDLSHLESKRGFGIHGLPGTGKAVAGAGDVNGDGLADVIVGTPFAYPGGKAYVVFGKPGGSGVELTALGSGGFEIEGPPGFGSLFGLSVAGVGDINGDGLADVAAGAPFAGSGAVAVVYGKSTSAPVDPAAGDGAGFLIEGEPGEQTEAGWSVAGPGDVNGDGRPDVLIGAPTKLTVGFRSAGAGYVVFGKPDSATVQLAAVAAGAGGFRMDGVLGDDAGRSVNGAGDVNGDGVADVLVGAPRADNNGRSGSGSAYVVMGSRTPASFNLGAAEQLGLGFRIDGAAAGDAAGAAVGPAGDQTGDGRDDLAVGAVAADGNGRRNSGSAYVLGP